MTLPLRFLAVTFALDDADPGAIEVWPGSHRLPDLPFPGGHLSVPEARRAGVPNLDAARARRSEALGVLLRRHEARPLAAVAGTRVVRHANLVHGSNASERGWRSVTAWYCPDHALPCYVETPGETPEKTTRAIPGETTRVRSHGWDGTPFSSGVYPNLEPRD